MYLTRSSAVLFSLAAAGCGSFFDDLRNPFHPADVVDMPSQNPQRRLAVVIDGVTYESYKNNTGLAATLKSANGASVTCIFNMGDWGLYGMGNCKDEAGAEHPMHLRLQKP
jgi:hypothetical protein